MEEKKGTRLLTIGEMLRIRDKAFYNALCDELGLNRNLLRFKAVILRAKPTSNKQSKKTTMDMKLFKNEELEVVQLFQNEELMSFTDEKCWAYMSGLTEREQRVILMRFGLGEYNHSYNLKEVGEKVGVTPEMVRSIEEKAFRKMRRYVKLNLSSEEFVKYLEDEKRKAEEKLIPIFEFEGCEDFVVEEDLELEEDDDFTF